MAYGSFQAMAQSAASRILIQFEKKVHTAWVARYSGRRSNLIKLCWFGGGGGIASGLGVLQAENRHCSPSF